MTWAGLTSFMLSAPGEPTALITQALSDIGVPKVVAGPLGLVGEIVLRSPLANPVGLVKALVGGYGVGRVLGSDPTLEPVFDPIPEGYTRTKLRALGALGSGLAFKQTLGYEAQQGTRVL